VWICSIGLLVALPAIVLAKTEKPTVVAEEFFRFLSQSDYESAADLLSAADHAAVRNLQVQTGEQAKQELQLPKILTDTFFLMQGQNNNTEITKPQDGETIMPRRITFFVPGQYYIVGNFAAVFTRETYELAHADTGPVRDDPRKLWIDPTNVLSKVRDEAYFKQWWIWEEDRLTMPGLVWLLKKKTAGRSIYSAAPYREKRFWIFYAGILAVMFLKKITRKKKNHSRLKRRRPSPLRLRRTRLFSNLPSGVNSGLSSPPAQRMRHFRPLLNILFILTRYQVKCFQLALAVLDSDVG